MAHIWETVLGFFQKPNEGKSTNFGEELRKVMQSRDFEQKLQAASPVLVTSLIAWPTFWAYKGLEWNKSRAAESLPVYIKKAFFQAKLMQLMIISAGILMAVRQGTQHKTFNVHNV